jgi:hypothetical protein
MKKLVILFLAVAAFTACSKEEGIAPNAEKALTRQAWKGDQVLVNGQADTSGFFDIKNTQITFEDGGTYKVKDLSSGDEDSGKWELNEEETKVTMDKGTSDEEIWDLIDCNKKKLTMKMTDQGTTIQMSFLPVE